MTFGIPLVTVTSLVDFGEGSGVVATTIVHWAATLLSAVLVFVRASLAAYKAHNLDFTHGLMWLVRCAWLAKDQGLRIAIGVEADGLDFGVTAPSSKTGLRQDLVGIIGKYPPW